MTRLVSWCYRIGLASGVLALGSALLIVLYELGFALPATAREVAERAFLVFGLAFMWLGGVLLIAAIVWLTRSWPRLSRSVKVVSVLGLGASTFLGAYVFHWLIPDLRQRRV